MNRHQYQKNKFSKPPTGLLETFIAWHTVVLVRIMMNIMYICPDKKSSFDHPMSTPIKNTGNTATARRRKILNYWGTPVTKVLFDKINEGKQIKFTSTPERRIGTKQKKAIWYCHGCGNILCAASGIMMSASVCQWMIQIVLSSLMDARVRNLLLAWLMHPLYKLFQLPNLLPLFWLFKYVKVLCLITQL